MLEATRFVEKKVYISEAEIAEEKVIEPQVLEKKGLFICGCNCLCK